ncbi:hypothetical protein B0H63DRAFT_526193 [Podospora didyma]|uniref:RRM domain-containing protein n=1 Tax=Podospora didyma TaxID=330526 RepID=A0AAE0KEU7_9PEZI|nr:hypothetical protein B0H63DRAFT_526193 [Podospora didyma]
MAATNGNQAAAPDLGKIIEEGRNRKKNEALAVKIFGRDRRTSLPAKGTGGGLGPLASRAGVKKQQRAASSNVRPAGNIDGEWTHDLHEESVPTGPRGDRRQNNNRNGPNPIGGSLASRITNPNAGPAGNPRQKRQAARRAEALIKSELQPRAPQNATRAASSFGAGTFSKGMTIRGLAGPYVVMAQNFAPGTTAADIESAMTPVGGIISSCRVIKHSPIVVAEVVFESREGAENAVSTFHNQTADGRILQVYFKPGNTVTPRVPEPSSYSRSPRADDNIIDGTHGFVDHSRPVDEMDDGDEMETDSSFTSRGNGRQPPRGPAAGGGGLYSDNILRAAPRGRGYGRGRGGNWR